MESLEATGHLSTDVLFRQHAGFVARFLARMGVPSEQLEDALQEVFLVAHRNGGYRPGPAKPTSYLAGIAVRAAARHRQRVDIAKIRHSDAAVELLSSEHADPVEAAQRRQDLERLHAALERLPEELASTLLLVELEGQSCVSIAAGSGCAVGTVYWRLHEARKQLQSALRSVDAKHDHSQRVRARASEREQRERSLSGLLGLGAFQSTEASKLLELAREQPVPTLAFEAMLARHQQLVASGAVPAWGSGLTPQASSWLSLLGGGPLAAGALGLVALGAFVGMPQADLPAQALPARDASRPVAESVSAPTVRVPRELELSARLASGEQAARPSPEAQRALQRELEPQPAASARRAEPRATNTPPVEATALSAQPETDEVPAAPDAPEPATKTAALEPEPVPELPLEPRRSATATSPDAELAEMREIARAEQLLKDDPARALALTRKLRAGYPDGHFQEERAYLEVMALRALGRTRELEQSAAAFLNAYPAGLYSGRVREAAGSQRE